MKVGEKSFSRKEKYFTLIELLVITYIPWV